MPTVCADRQRRTCIEITRGAEVKYVLLSQTGILLDKLPVSKFDAEFGVRYPDYPVDKAARNYVTFARNLGATEEALKELVKLIPKDITKEIQMIVEKGAAKERVEAAKAASKKKSDEQKALTPKERDLAKKAFFGDKKAAEQLTKVTAKKSKAGVPWDEPKAKKSATKVEKVKPTKVDKTKPASTKEKKPSASQMFCDLIMAGKLTDDQIFTKVQDAFGLDDKKKGYVKWYRANLIKQGKKVPAAK
jgi:hypothetical protein